MPTVLENKLRLATLKYFDRTVDEILQGTSGSLKKISRDQTVNLIKMLVEAKISNKKVMVLGAGRSGLVARSFAMRLMHLTFNVHVIGETITPGQGRRL